MVVKCDIVDCIYFRNFKCSSESVEIVPDNHGEFCYIKCATYKEDIRRNKWGYKK